MKKNTGRMIIDILEGAMLLVLIIILAISLRKIKNLEVQTSELQNEVTELKNNTKGTDKDISDKEPETESVKTAETESIGSESENKPEDNSAISDRSTASEQNSVSGDSTTVNQSIANTPSESEYITRIINLPAGTVLPKEKIDIVNLGNYFTQSLIAEGDEVYDRIMGQSYVPNENISLENLRYLKVLHWNYDSKPQVGELIVNAAIAEDVLEIFTELYNQNYQIYSMHLVDDYWQGDGEKSDTASIDRDNTSAFCYRFVTGSDSRLSNHAYGCAIDLNPMENPYVKIQADGSRTTYHENAQGYVYNRSSETPHVIDENDLAYKLFTEHGFEWGGHWENPIDYQHFEKKLYG